MNILPFEKQVAVISCLCEGMSIRATARLTDVDKGTVKRLGARVGAGWSTASTTARSTRR